MLARLRSAGPGRGFGLGLILLALWLQVLSPAARLHRAALQEMQAVAGAIICGHDQAPADAAGQPSPADHRDHHCPFCRVQSLGPVATGPPPPVSRLAWHPVAWPMPPPPRGRRAVVATRQARAPPSA